MVTMAAEPVFLDANVLVYATVPSSAFHEAARERVLELQQTRVRLWISRQVIREYMAAVSRLQPVEYKPTLLHNAERMQSLYQVAEDGPMVMDHLFGLLNETCAAGKQIHDANIVATMLTYGITRLLTHNMKAFDRFSHLIKVIPVL
jgi:predicted nucleic acid-binding protein